MRILVPSTAFSDAARRLREGLPGDEVVIDPAADSGTYDVIVPFMGRIDSGLMDRVTPRLIQQFGVGLEGVDRDAAAARGIPVANVPAAGTGNSEGVGEIAVLHLLALARRYHGGGEAVARGRLGEPVGRTLLGARVVVLGLGDVGAAVAARLRGFGCELVGVGTRDRAAAQRACEELGLSAYRSVGELADAVAGALALVVCCVLTPETRGLVDGAVLRALGPTGFVVNVARGPVVDYVALLSALQTQGLGGAGLDVYWNEPIDPGDPLLACPGLSLSPHIGGVTDLANARMGEAVIANIERLRRGEPVVEAR